MSDMSLSPRREGGFSSKSLRKFIGVSLMVAAVGIWIFGGADWSYTQLLVKTGLTAVFSFAAIACLFASR